MSELILDINNKSIVLDIELFSFFNKKSHFKKVLKNIFVNDDSLLIEIYNNFKNKNYFYTANYLMGKSKDFSNVNFSDNFIYNRCLNIEDPINVFFNYLVVLKSLEFKLVKNFSNELTLLNFGNIIKSFHLELITLSLPYKTNIFMDNLLLDIVTLIPVVKNKELNFKVLINKPLLEKQVKYNLKKSSNGNYYNNFDYTNKYLLFSSLIADKYFPDMKIINYLGVECYLVPDIIINDVNFIKDLNVEFIKESELFF